MPGNEDKEKKPLDPTVAKYIGKLSDEEINTLLPDLKPKERRRWLLERLDRPAWSRYLRGGGEPAWLKGVVDELNERLKPKETEAAKETKGPTQSKETKKTVPAAPDTTEVSKKRKTPQILTGEETL